MEPLNPEQAKLAGDNFQLVNDYLKLIYVDRRRLHLVQIAFAKIGREAARDAATTALLAAAQKYRPLSGGASFRRFAYYCMGQKIRNVANNRRTAFEQSRQALPPVIIARENDPPCEELDVTVKAAMQDALSERSRIIIQRRFYDGHTLLAIGHALGITRERVRQLQIIALRQLRNHLSGQIPRAVAVVKPPKRRKRRIIQVVVPMQELFSPAREPSPYTPFTRMVVGYVVTCFVEGTNKQKPLFFYGWHYGTLGSAHAAALQCQQEEIQRRTKELAGRFFS